MKYIAIYLFLLIMLPYISYAEGLSTITGKLLKEGCVTVDAKANIYGAGKTEPPALAGGGAGILPIVIDFEPREQDGQQVLIFPSITGQISCTNSALLNDADGANFCLGSTNIAAFNGFSGVKANKTMFLVGVFTSDEDIQQASAPLDLTQGGDDNDGYASLMLL